MIDTRLPAILMTHRAYLRGRDNLMDADLTRLVEVFPDLSPVLEELQYLRRQHDYLEGRLADLET